MANGKTCACGRENWVVIHYKHNHSYFETPKGGWHRSDYSTIECKKCGHVFHTKAKYVDTLPLCNSKGCMVGCY